MNNFPKEDIPNDDKVFRRIIPNQNLISSLNFSTERSLSMDWEEYSTAEEARDRMAGSTSQDTSKNGVVSFISGNLRRLQLHVNHTPRPWNRAHTDVIKPDQANNSEIRIKMNRMYKWEIKVSS